jgi:hypothetical protein
MAAEPVTVWLVERGKLKVYSDGALVGTVPSNEFPRMIVKMAEELREQQHVITGAGRFKSVRGGKAGQGPL